MSESFLAAARRRAAAVRWLMGEMDVLILVGEFAGRKAAFDSSIEQPALLNVEGGGQYDERVERPRWPTWKYGRHWELLHARLEITSELIHDSALPFDNHFALAHVLDNGLSVEYCVWPRVPLLVAFSALGRAKCVEVLLRRGATVTYPLTRLEQQYVTTWQPVQAAVSGQHAYNSDGGREDNPGLEHECEDDDTFGGDDLMAIRRHTTSGARARCLELLLEHRASPDVSFDGKTTPLMMAAALGRYRCVELLIAANSNVNAEDGVNQGLRTYRVGGQTALHHCARGIGRIHRGHLESARLLLEARADINHRACRREGINHDQEKWGVLSLALRPTSRVIDETVDRLQFAELLCTYGAQPGQADDDLANMGILDGWTAPASHQEWKRMRGVWLDQTPHFSSSLHFLEALSEHRTRELLRGGADLGARSAIGDADTMVFEAVLAGANEEDVEPHPTPISRALKLLRDETTAEKWRREMSGKERLLSSVAQSESKDDNEMEDVRLSLVRIFRNEEAGGEQTRAFSREIDHIPVDMGEYHGSKRPYTRKIYAGSLTFSVDIEWQGSKMSSMTITLSQLTLNETQQRSLEWDEVWVLIDLPRVGDDNVTPAPSWSYISTPRLPRKRTLERASYNLDLEVTFREGGEALAAMQRSVEETIADKEKGDWSEIFFEIYTKGNPKANLGPARLVVRAAEPWSVANHELFPDDKRAFVRFLLLLGVRFRSLHYLPLDLFIGFVLPSVVTRDSGPPGEGQYVSQMMNRNDGQRHEYIAGFTTY